MLNLDKFFIDTENKIYGSREGFNHDGVWNAVVKVRGHSFRERSELLLIKDNCILIQRKDPWDLSYKIPGGSTDKDLTVVETAVKECEEEALIVPKEVKYFGTYDVFFGKDVPVPKWLKVAKYPVEYKGYHTHICVGRYDKPYEEHIDDADKDDFYKKAKWIPISDAMKFLKDYHKRALEKYLNIIKV